MPRTDYAVSLLGERSLSVPLSDGRGVSISRLRFDGFIQLKSLEARLVEAFGKSDASTVALCFDKYIATSTKEPIGGRDVFVLFAAIFNLNSLRSTMSFMEIVDPKQKKEEVPWDYPNRAYAVIVHKIAVAYHWSRQEILNLWPDEVFCYMQEILNDDWQAQSWEWEMAGFGWVPEKNGSSRRNAFPTPVWAQPRTKLPEKVKMKKEFLPLGNVQDLGGFGLEYHARQSGN